MLALQIFCFNFLLSIIASFLLSIFDLFSSNFSKGLIFGKSGLGLQIVISLNNNRVMALDSCKHFMKAQFLSSFS